MKNFLILLILLLVNLFIGCLSEYIKYKEITVATIIMSVVCGWIVPLFYVFEKLFQAIDKLDEIKIISKRNS